MNPTFDQISCSDAAKMLGVSRTSVATWCRHNIVNYIDISEPNSSVPRYVLTETEVDKIKRAMKRHGKQYWTKHYCKTRGITSPKKPADDSNMFLNVADDVIICDPSSSSEETVSNVTDSSIDSSGVSEESVKKIKNTIIYIKQIKAQLNDLEQEKAMLTQELETMRKEIMDFVDF